MAKRFLGTQSQRYTAVTSTVTAVPLTLACFASADNVTANHPVMGVSDASGLLDAFYISMEGGSAGDPVSAVSVASNVFAVANGTPAYAAGRVHHVAGVFSSTTSRISYLDGRPGTANTTSSTPSGIDTTSIGASGRSFFATGNVFDAAIWSAALTAAEILRLSSGESPLTVRRDALVAYWPCDELGDSVVDMVSGRVLSGAGTTLPRPIPTPGGYRKRGKTARIYSFAPEIAAGGATAVPVFRHHYVQQGIA